MGDETDCGRSNQDTSTAERGDRWDGDVLRHDLLATGGRVKDGHNIGATGTHEGKPIRLLLVSSAADLYHPCQ